jgi:signal peptidase I
LPTVIVVAVTLIAFQVTRLGFSTYEVSSASMEPTLHCSGAPDCLSLESDHVLTNSWAYALRSVHRGDVVVLRRRGPGCGRGVAMIKRVIAIPGDLVVGKNEGVYVDGERLPNHGANGTADRTADGTRRFRLVKDEYYVLGDGSRSCDSREFGPVRRSEIIALAVLIYRPLRRFGVL